MLRMHFVWKYRPRSFTAIVEKTLIQYMYSQSDTVLQMHASLKRLKTGSHEARKQSGFRHTRIWFLYLWHRLSSSSSNICMMLMNHKLTTHTFTHPWSLVFVSRLLLFSVPATYHTSVQQLVITFTPHSVSLVWVRPFLWSDTLVLFVS